VGILLASAQLEFLLQGHEEGESSAKA